MIKTIEVTNYLGDSIVLDLAKPEESGFVVHSITGIGPGKASINTTDSATYDGSIYNSARMDTRNIVLGLKFLWKDTIEDVRHLSYKYFPLKKKVKLKFTTDNRVSEVEGYVESNEPNIFSKDEGADISIICPNPFFYAISNDVTDFSNIEPMFEFPFSNESVTNSLLEMSVINVHTLRTINYEGDAEIGMTITIHAAGSASNVTIYNVVTNETMKVDTAKLKKLTGSAIVSGDDIVICTEKGRKSINLIRAGKTTNIINCLTKDSDWLQLSPGGNTFAYTADSGELALMITISNRIAYEGV